MAAARREAQSAFGDPTVFCERYLATGHHVEVQVLADEHGTVWAVGERECSIQRRHQKIIEEAPSPLVERTPGMRAKLFDAARLAANAIGSAGAGTFGSMADEQQPVLLPRMNAQLQLEHQITPTHHRRTISFAFQLYDGPTTKGSTPNRARRTTTPSRPASTRRTRPRDSSRRPEPSAPLRSTRHHSPRRFPASSTGRSSTLYFDPMLAEFISYAQTRCHAASCSPTRSPAPGSTASAPTGTCSSMCYGVRPTKTQPPTPRFFDHHGLAELAPPLDRPGTVRWSALARTLAGAPRQE